MDDVLPKGTGLWRQVDVLTKRNRDKWFRSLERIAKGEECTFLLTHTLEAYCRVKDSERGGLAPEDGWTAIYIPSDQRTKENLWWENPTLRREYIKAEAGFLLNLEGKLDEADQERVRDLPNVLETVAKLREKYYATTYLTSS